MLRWAKLMLPPHRTQVAVGKWIGLQGEKIECTCSSRTSLAIHWVIGWLSRFFSLRSSELTLFPIRITLYTQAGCLFRLRWQRTWHRTSISNPLVFDMQIRNCCCWERNEAQADTSTKLKGSRRSWVRKVREWVGNWSVTTVHVAYLHGRLLSHLAASTTELSNRIDHFRLVRDRFWLKGRRNRLRWRIKDDGRKTETTFPALGRLIR